MTLLSAESIGVAQYLAKAFKEQNVELGSTNQGTTFRVIDEDGKTPEDGAEIVLGEARSILVRATPRIRASFNVRSRVFLPLKSDENSPLYNIEGIAKAYLEIEQQVLHIVDNLNRYEARRQTLRAAAKSIEERYGIPDRRFESKRKVYVEPGDLAGEFSVKVFAITEAETVRILEALGYTSTDTDTSFPQ